MPKEINYTLGKEDLSLVEAAIKGHADLRVRQRGQIIRLLHKGYKPAQVADLLGIKVNRIYWWHRRFREEGLAGLADRVRSGRPKSADEAYRQKLEETIETEPAELGYAFNVWDAGRLMAHLEKETGVVVCERTFRTILAEQDYVYRRPKHDLTPLQDKGAKAEAQATLEMLKKKPKPAKSSFSLWTKRP